MTSFIILSKNNEKRITYAKEFCAKQNINPFDIALIEKETGVKQNAQSIGIEDVKRIQKTLFLKPMQSEVKAVIIEEAHLLTPEAQNALLKVLEEPPAHTIIILCADSKEALLPTILSRCQVIALEEEQPKLTEKKREELETFLANLPTMSDGEKLKHAEKLSKDKDKALAWVERLILVFREQTLSSLSEVEGLETITYIHKLKLFQALHTQLKTTNVNPRFAIENTLLLLH